MQAVSSRDVRDCRDPHERPNGATTEVAGLLHPEETAFRHIAAVWADRRRHRRLVILSPGAVKHAHVYARQCCWTTGLEVDGMRNPESSQ